METRLFGELLSADIDVDSRSWRRCDVLVTMQALHEVGTMVRWGPWVSVYVALLNHEHHAAGLPPVSREKAVAWLRAAFYHSHPWKQRGAFAITSTHQVTHRISWAYLVYCWWHRFAVDGDWITPLNVCVAPDRQLPNYNLEMIISVTQMRMEHQLEFYRLHDQLIDRFIQEGTKKTVTTP